MDQILGSRPPSLLLATHSSELVAEADPTDILLVNKRWKSARRMNNVEALQKALEHLGSAHNMTLAQLARTRRLLFVEGEDFRLLRRFAERAGFQTLASGLDIVAVPVGGFGQWKRVTSSGWTFENALGQPVAMGAVFDRDYYCDEEIQEVEAELRRAACFVAVHNCKEIENYLLIPDVLNRCVNRNLAEAAKRRGAATPDMVDVRPILESITNEMRADTESQFIGKAFDYHRRSSRNLNNASISKNAIERFNQKWADLNSRLAVVGGKEVLSKLNAALQEKFGVAITPAAILATMKKEEVPTDMWQLLKELEAFRTRDLNGRVDG